MQTGTQEPSPGVLGKYKCHLKLLHVKSTFTVLFVRGKSFGFCSIYTYINIIEFFPTFSEFIELGKSYKVIGAWIMINFNIQSVTLWLGVKIGKMFARHMRNHPIKSFWLLIFFAWFVEFRENYLKENSVFLSTTLLKNGVLPKWNENWVNSGNLINHS